MAVETGDNVTRKYANFRGVDFRGEECSLNRSPDSLNVWKNYKKLACIETRPGLEHLHADEDGIRCMMWDNGKLYYIDNKGYLNALEFNKDKAQVAEICFIGENGVLFSFGGKLYAMGTERYQNVTDKKEVVPYIPTTSIARKPSGGGKIHEDVNLLTNRRINTFLADGVSTNYFVDAPYISMGGKIIVKHNDVALKGMHEVKEGEEDDSDYYVEWNSGFIDFKKPPSAPLTVGRDNVSIEFTHDSEQSYNGGVDESENKRNKILQCTLTQEFDNRVFFSGNPDEPNMVRHCSLENPGYVSDLDYYADGADSTPIRSMVAGNNGLWVFRDYSPSNNNVFYHTPALDDDYGKIYPSSHSSIAIGCVGRACNFNDDIVFFSRRGMEGASTDITTEQFVTHRSSLVDRMMLTNDKYKDMVLAEWEGYLFVFIGSNVYLADSRAVTTIENHIEYEWYHWNLGDGVVVASAVVHDGILYIGTKDGHIYSFTRDPKEGDIHSGQVHESINSYWTTPLDRFGAQNKLKTTNKKGCVVEAKGDISVYVKVEDTDFEYIGTYENIEDYFASRIKRKKWKDIQLKFQSNTQFSLETATLEAYVGGYIKR